MAQSNRIGRLVGHRQKFFYVACAQYRGLDFLGIHHCNGRYVDDLFYFGAPRQYVYRAAHSHENRTEGFGAAESCQ